MLTITRRLANTLKTVFRMGLNLSTRGPHPPVCLEFAQAGYRIRCRTAEATAEYCMTDEPLTNRIIAPFSVLSDCGANNDQPLAVEQNSDGIFARWQDAAVPQVRKFESVELPEEAWPELPERLAENHPLLLRALHDASQNTDPNSARYALGCIQLSGDGRISATDGRQALVQRGFDFPWDGQVLLPVSKVFNCKHLPAGDAVQIGKADQWLTLRVGHWRFQFKLSEGRFPRIDDMLQPTANAVAKIEFQPTDREFLRENLWLLPGDKDFHSPCTFDLNGKIALRAKASDADTVTELILSNSTRTGEAIRFNTNRRYVERAIQLGFDRICVTSAASPAFCQDELRHYLWALLEAKDALMPTPEAIQIESPVTPSVPAPVPSRAERTTVPKTKNAVPDQTAHHKTTRPEKVQHATADAPISNGEEPASAIDQAIALRSSLHSAASHVSNLVRVLKREKRQHRAVRSTLLSLRQLQAIDA